MTQGEFLSLAQLDGDFVAGGGEINEFQVVQ